MNVKILIVGSTGKLGSKLLGYMHKNDIQTYCITCFQNIKKLNFQKKKIFYKKIFCIKSFRRSKKFL